jgi:uncharacterized protein YcbK (DUF882 family)
MKANYISENFQRSEFECRCGCGFATVDVELIEILERLREYYGKPISINSGCRCKIYNKSIGGASQSRHMEGIAADINIKGVEPSEVQSKLKQWYPNQYGIGCYNTFTHVDSRAKKARW